MKRLFVLPLAALALGCEKAEVHLPPTAAAQQPCEPCDHQHQHAPVAITKDTGELVCRHDNLDGPEVIEEFEGVVELFGHKLRARREVKLDREGNYVRHGKAVAWYESGQKAGEMWFAEDKPHGKQHIWYESGRRKLHGEWKEGLAHGEWIEWYENGTKKSEGHFLAGMKDGHWSYWNENGQLVDHQQFDKGHEISVADRYAPTYQR